MLGHEHFGRLRPHHHTSYAALGFLLLLTTVLVAGFSWSAEAAQPAVNPQSGSIGLSGTVPTTAPTGTATIVSPSNGSHTTKIPIPVSGTCPAGDFVVIEKNNVFAGAAQCQANGSFSVDVDLFVGANVLVARVSDALGQFGPDSAGVTVYYDAPAVPSGGASQQLFVETNTFILGTPLDSPLARSVTIVGGVGPYAISWDFGDNATSLASAAAAGSASATHTYTQAGLYTVIVRVTDSTGASAYLQMLAVANGATPAYGANNSTGSGALPGVLVAIWPILGLMAVMVLVFWLGERREAYKLRNRTRGLV